MKIYAVIDEMFYSFLKEEWEKFQGDKIFPLKNRLKFRPKGVIKIEGKYIIQSQTHKIFNF